MPVLLHSSNAAAPRDNALELTVVPRVNSALPIGSDAHRHRIGLGSLLPVQSYS